MGQIKLNTRQLLVEVLEHLKEKEANSFLIYDGQRYMGKVSCKEITDFLNYKGAVEDIYYHKLHLDMGTVLHIISGLRSQGYVKKAELSDRNWMFRFSAAAVIGAILLGMAWWFFKPEGSGGIEQGIAVNAEVMRAGKAILLIGDDQEINITDARPGIIYKESGVELVKLNDKQLEYHLINAGKEQGKRGTHTITVPNGAHYELLLSDGTKVWLNAASSVKFPAKFVSSASRNLFLSGEAYIEVAHQAEPFVLFTRDQKIRVFGTRFNVNAYENESSTKTTLLEGSLEVCSDIESVLLKPAEQATLNESGLFVSTIVGGECAAWKDGEFVFRNMPLEDIMRVIERQYNIEVVYHKNDKKGSLLGGTILLSSKLIDVLGMLELTSNAHFEVKGNSVNVM